MIELLNLALKLNTVINPFIPATSSANNHPHIPSPSLDPSPSIPKSTIEQNPILTQAIRVASAPRSTTIRAGTAASTEWTANMNACHQTLSGRSELSLTGVEDSGPWQRHMLTVDNYRLQRLLRGRAGMWKM